MRRVAVSKNFILLSYIDKKGRLMINMMKLVLMLAFGLCRAGVMKRDTVEIDACSVCDRKRRSPLLQGRGDDGRSFGGGLPRCSAVGRQRHACDCGSVDQVRLARTTVCEDLAENATIAILNGKKCVSLFVCFFFTLVLFLSLY